MLNELIRRINEELASNNVDLARKILENAWTLAKSKNERTELHDLGNVIQRAIFNQYLGQV